MKKIVIVSKGAGGKDYLKGKLIERGLKPSVSYTTRPPRDGEQEGKSYYFISKDKFEDMIINNQFLEYNRFGDNKWYYGTSKKDFMESDLFIMTPSGINKLSPYERSKCLVVYLNIPEEVRLKRLIARNDKSDAPERRIKSDEETFVGFSDFDMEITDPYFDDTYIDKIMNAR